MHLFLHFFFSLLLSLRLLHVVIQWGKGDHSWLPVLLSLLLHTIINSHEEIVADLRVFRNDWAAAISQFPFLHVSSATGLDSWHILQGRPHKPSHFSWYITLHFLTCITYHRTNDVLITYKTVFLILSGYITYILFAEKNEWCWIK